MTANHKIKLQAALLSAQAGGDARKAVKLAAAFQAHVQGDKRIAACDVNPFGVRVAIRRTLIPALDALQSALLARV